jgi:flagellar hook-length control protein FliK
LLQLNFAYPKTVKAESPAEAAQAPAAGYFSENKAGGKVERGAEGFARTLEKVQQAGKAVGSETSGGPVAVESKSAEKTPKDPAEPSAIFQELLDGLNEQQLIRVLMEINPQQLLRYLESLGLDPAALLVSGDLSDTNRMEGKGQLNRNRLVDLLTSLSQLLGHQTVLDAIAATAGEKRPSDPKAAAAATAGKGKTQEIGEARNVGRKPRVVVLDLRKEQPGTKEAPEQPNSVKNSFTLTMERAAESPERDASLLFRAPYQDRVQAPALEASVRTTRAASNFQQRFVPEVVKQTGIILKEGGNGEIRLVLKPENLGSIRIRLALSESSLEGRIVVDNDSVKELVESSLGNLKNALRLEGYQTNLEVSVGHRRSWNGNEQAQTQPTGWLAGGGSEEFDKAIPLYLDMKLDYELVNLYA